MSPVHVEMVAMRGSSSSPPSSSPTSSPSLFSVNNSQDENRDPKRDNDVRREDANLVTNDNAKPYFRFNRFLFDTSHLVGVSDDNDVGCGGDDDDDLTSLAWLQDVNLLKNIASKPSQRDTTPLESTYCITGRRVIGSPGRSDISKSQDCLLIGSRKPRLSFSSLIYMAIESSPEKQLPVKGIYDWITKNFPYFKDARPGWKNSIRHNLSYNRYFKNSCSKDLTGTRKCSRWYVDPKYKHLLRLALFKPDAKGHKNVITDLIICDRVGKYKEHLMDYDNDEYEEENDGCNMDMDAASTLANLSCIIGQQVGLQGPSVSRNKNIHLVGSGSSSPEAFLSSSSSPSSSLATSQNMNHESTEEVQRWELKEIPMESSVIGRGLHEPTNGDAGETRNNFDRSRTMEGINALLGLAGVSE